MQCIKRRAFLLTVAGTTAFPFTRDVAWALDYPTRPVRIIVGFAPGGATDIIARLLGEALSNRLGQTFIVENKPGASSNIAAEAVIAAPADGYTLLFVGPPNAINASLYAKLDFNFMRDIVPIASIVRVPFVMVVNPSLPIKTVAEFIDYAKANPGKLSLGTPGIGSGPYMAAELFKAMTAVDVVAVQYRGDAPALADLLGGQIQACFNSLPAAIALIKAGKVRALATTAATRSDILPDLPTVAEFVSGYEASAFYGIGAPKGTPAPIIDKLNQSIQAALVDQTVRARLIGLGGTIVVLSAPKFGRLIAEETNKWAKVIKFADIKPE